MRLAVENCSVIQINDLQKRIRKIITKDYPDSTEEESYKYSLQEFKKFSVNGQTFEYKANKNYLGGYRWFFICPKCKSPVNKLVLPPESAKNKERLYLCKTCHAVKNQSALMGQSSMYQKVTKPLKRMKEIEDKIAIGHLSLDKSQELLDEYDALEKQLKNSPEYRIYVFKKTHNLLGA
jgi:hypothetical protein